MNDHKRLSWLQSHDGYALISDDNGNWAIVCDGMQQIADDPPDDLWTSYLVEKRFWKSTIRQAIDYAMENET